MNEATLKQALCQDLRTLTKSVVLRHEDVFRAGNPDISVTWSGLTVWLEVKYDTKTRRMESRGIQNLTCRQLALAGWCFYVIYEDLEEKQTLIVDPENFENGRIVNRDFNKYWGQGIAKGFSHSSVTNFIRNLANGHHHR